MGRERGSSVDKFLIAGADVMPQRLDAFLVLGSLFIDRLGFGSPVIDLFFGQLVRARFRDLQLSFQLGDFRIGVLYQIFEVA